jgi:diguanylate cyclase (GGDEF)-like protein
VEASANGPRAIPIRPRRAASARIHLLALAAGILALLAGVAGWWVRGGPDSIEELILVLDFTIGGTVLVTGALVGRARAAEQRRVAQLDALRAAASRMRSSTSVEAVGRAVVEETRRVIDYHNARVYLLEDGNALVPIAFEGRIGVYDQVDLAILRTRVGEGLTGWVAEHREPALVHDASADPRSTKIAGTDDVDESMLVVPMLHEGHLLGVVTLSKLGLRRFDLDDLRLLGALADQAATALASARHLQEMRRLAEELRLLLEMNGALSQSLDPRAVGDLMADHLARAAGADEVQISDWDRPNDRVRSLGVYPPARAEHVAPFYGLADFPATRAVLEEQRIAVVDVDDPDADPAEAALLRRDGMRGLIMLPLVAKGESIGLVELEYTGRPPDDPARITLARTMTHEAAIALENARLYEVARDLADRDPLTGFYNHRALHQRLAEELARAARARRTVSVLMMDLDGFKTANDTFGHLYGDGVLVHVAQRIRSVTRTSDVAARWGGDEFAILLPETDQEGAAAVAQHILAALRESPYAPDDRRPYPVVGSIGVASFPRHGRTVTEVVTAADLALYAAKGEGGDTVRIAGAGHRLGLPERGEPAAVPARGPARSRGAVAGGAVG